MERIRFRCVPLLAVGIANLFLSWAPFMWEWSWSLTIPLLVLLGLAAGFVTEEKPVFTVLVLLMPSLFAPYGPHGRPIEWLLASMLCPPFLVFFAAYYVQNLGLLIPIYLVFVEARRWLRRFYAPVLEK